MRARPRTCPWVNYPTHKRNRQIQVNGEVPIVYGYCAQEPECASCAGTLYKPNLRVELGMSFTFVECPFCTPVEYRKRVDRLKPTLRVGMGPKSTPLDPPPQPEQPPDAAPKKKKKPH